MILRDRDANTAWESQADGTLEERVYYCQNWRADVVALMTDSGELINQVRYDPYGVPFGIAKADLDADGDVDGDDYTQFSTYYSAGTMPYADWNWDGTKDTADITAYLNDKNADAGLGRGDPSYAYGTEGGANRKAYAGYEIDPVLTGSEGWESVYHVRHRVLLSQLGRWTRRDPSGYVDGPNLLGYPTDMPLVVTDPLGLRPCPGKYMPRPGRHHISYEPNPQADTYNLLAQTVRTRTVSDESGYTTLTERLIARVFAKTDQDYGNFYAEANTTLSRQTIIEGLGRFSISYKELGRVQGRVKLMIDCDQSTAQPQVYDMANYAASETTSLSFGFSDATIAAAVRTDWHHIDNGSVLAIFTHVSGGFSTSSRLSYSIGVGFGGGSAGVSIASPGNEFWFNRKISTHYYHCDCVVPSDDLDSYYPIYPSNDPKTIRF